MVLGKKGVWLQRINPTTGLALSNLTALAASKQVKTSILVGTNTQGADKERDSEPPLGGLTCHLLGNG